MSKLTIGADPEFFVRRGSHYISGHVFPCGSKHLPLKTAHGHVQVDGIALEVNVKPSETRDEFISNIRSVMSDVTGIMNKYEPTAQLVTKPSIFFGSRRLSELPPENAELGCEPDFNAWENNRINKRPNAAAPIRTGAGHIHVGWTEHANPHSIKHMRECASLVRQLDYYLGMPSLLWDKDTRRRLLYGKAGAFRPKPYGVEYRVLSNAWLETDKLIGWVFDRTVAAVRDLWNGNDLSERYGQLAASVIDSNKMNWNKHHAELSRELL